MQHASAASIAMYTKWRNLNIYCQNVVCTAAQLTPFVSDALTRTSDQDMPQGHPDELLLQYPETRWVHEIQKLNTRHTRECLGRG